MWKGKEGGQWVGRTREVKGSGKGRRTGYEYEKEGMKEGVEGGGVGKKIKGRKEWVKGGGG